MMTTTEKHRANSQFFIQVVSPMHRTSHTLTFLAKRRKSIRRAHAGRTNCMLYAFLFSHQTCLLDEFAITSLFYHFYAKTSFQIKQIKAKVKVLIISTNIQSLANLKLKMKSVTLFKRKTSCVYVYNKILYEQQHCALETTKLWDYFVVKLT